jgi:type IV pilus assembly protein PilY1
MNANPAATSTEKAVITDTLTTSCGTSTLQTDEGRGVYALNWARYMKNNGVAKTYAVGILGPTCNAEYAAHLTKLGSTEVGGGKFYGTNSYSDLVIALNTALTEILSVNSVFSSVSLPSSVNTQGSYLNQVFIGMFRPDDTFSPRWMGNLKQYQLGYVNGVLQTLDADGSTAINSNTGFIAECARSFWTPNSLDSYWDNYDKKGTCTAIADSAYSNYPDGNMVEKGGSAYKLRAATPASRAVKTCGSSMATCTALSTFGTATVSQSQLGAASSTEQTTLVNWARGTNTEDELDKGTTVMRPSVHGDVVHSRPAPVNHGASDDNPQVVVYYGANDGMLHAINGNQTANIVSNGSTYGPGEELWSFMPPEFYGNIRRLYRNTPAITFPYSAVSDATPKPYGMDGPVTSLKATVGGQSKTYVYAAMRRGGRAVYAFDVTTPGNPSLLWKRGCATSSMTDSDCSSGYSEIGQTWSTVKTVYASNYGSGASPLIIMGGGYDTCEDYDAMAANGANHNCTSSSKGKKVYVIDAVTGSVVRSFDTVAPSGGVARGVISDATVVNSNGAALYAYMADLGGNVYRISFTGNSSSDWAMTRIASLGCSTPSSCTANRKFMYAPSVVTTDNTTYYVLLGSGDREKPVNYYASATAVTNYFFMVKDKPGDATWLTSENSTCSANVICLSSLQPITTSTPTDAQLTAKKGWYLALSSSEQVVTSAITIYGNTFFSTHQPAATNSNSCSTNLGTTNVYNISYLNAAGNFSGARSQAVTGGGLPPSPVFANVLVRNYDYGTKQNIGGGGTSSVPVCVSGCDFTSPEQAQKVTGASSVVRHKSRLFWYIQK